MHPHQPPGAVVAAGQFRIISVLGRGSQGVTYEAERVADGRRVALKELTFAGLRDWKSFELFEREARVLEALDHPNIPSFLGLFRDDADGQLRCYIAQSLAPGRTLAALGSKWWCASISRRYDAAEPPSGNPRRLPLTPS